MSPRLNLGSTTASPLQPETPEKLLLPRVMERTARSNEGSWPERIYNSHYGNAVPAVFTSLCCQAER